MRIHFIAIGGSAIHNLAIALAKAGNTVSGSDDEIFEPSRSRLQKYGLMPEQQGWFTDKIHEGLDTDFMVGAQLEGFEIKVQFMALIH